LILIVKQYFYLIDYQKYDINSIYQFFYNFITNLLSSNLNNFEIYINIFDSITNNILSIIQSNFNIKIKEIDSYINLTTKFDSDLTRLNCIEILG
jgi:hypothetical protein